MINVRNTGFVIIVLALFACNRVKETTKDAIHTAGEVAGKSASEFGDGVVEGIDQTFGCTVKLSPELIASGVSTGKYTLPDSAGYGKYTLSIYLIFAKDYSTPIQAIVNNEAGLEYGRTKCTISAKAGEAGYYDFVFDKRTSIESKSVFILK
jgi:hypothetical protein